MMNSFLSFFSCIFKCTLALLFMNKTTSLCIDWFALKTMHSNGVLIFALYEV